MTAKAIFDLEADLRNDLGKSASRRLRREDKVLGVVYGGEEAAVPVVLEQRIVKRALENDAFYSHILSLTIKGKKQQVVLRDLQRHPYKPIILHMDFQRVKATDKLVMRIPLHFHHETECVGVQNGGIINHHMIDVEIRCQANQIPEHIDVDVANLEVEGIIHLSELKLPAVSELVMLAHGHDVPVVSVHLPRQTKLDVEEAEEEAKHAAEAAAEAAADAAAAALGVDGEKVEGKKAEGRAEAKAENKQDQDPKHQHDSKKQDQDVKDHGKDHGKK
jgi:large subunit ribosomal protein L25